MNDVACQLPMAFNKKYDAYCVDAFDQSGELRVTAVNRVHHREKNVECGECIKVTNIHSEKSTVVMVIDFVDDSELDMCPEAFKAIDNSQKDGHFQGHMTVQWHKASCNSLIGNDTIKYRYKLGSNRKWFMGVSLMYPKIPLARSNAVQISNDEYEPKLWRDCEKNGANGYWFCNVNKSYNEDDPFFLQLRSIDGQVLVDKIRDVEGNDEEKLIEGTNYIQFQDMQKIRHVTVNN